MNSAVNNLGVTLLIYSFVLLMFSLSIYIFKKEKIYRGYPQGWLDIKSNPIPKDIKNFIATDGKTVEVIYMCTWGPYGEIYFNRYDKTFVTHWQLLPDVP